MCPYYEAHAKRIKGRDSFQPVLSYHDPPFFLKTIPVPFFWNCDNYKERGMLTAWAMRANMHPVFLGMIGWKLGEGSDAKVRIKAQ